MSTQSPLLLFLVFFLSLSFVGRGQNDDQYLKTADFIRFYKKGDDLLVKKKYDKALIAFQKAVAIQPLSAAAQRRTGLSYELLHDFANAAKHYDLAIEANPEYSRTLYFQAGEMHLKAGNFEQAARRLKSYQVFLNLPPDGFENGKRELETEAYFNTLLDNYLKSCQFGMQKMAFEKIELNNLGKQINSELDESFIYLANDESWIFYTQNIPYDTEDRLMYSTFEKRQGWQPGKRLLNRQLNKEFNQGMGKISRDGTTMYFPGCNREDFGGSCDILKATMKLNEVLDISLLDQKVNSEYWESQPSINCEGTSLYFVSNRPGGFGGTDIWVSHLQANGTWTKAVNLGEQINTPGDEESPFIADDNITLYFSSNGHPGYGDSDIFFSVNSETGEWSKPQNLGPSVNSPAREISFFMNARGNKGYIASGRKGGYGNLDLYEFTIPQSARFPEIAYIKGQVVDDITGKPVQTVVYLGDKGNYATDTSGRFFACHPVNSKLKAIVSEKKYQEFEESFSLDNWNSEGFAELEIRLKPLNPPVRLAELTPKTAMTPKHISRKEEIKVAPVLPVETADRPSERIFTSSDVFFYFDDYSLTKEARLRLDNLIEELDKDQLALIIIEGYADHIGTEEYNMNLSEKRAEAVADYFKARGYKNLKIKYRGYGELPHSLVFAKNRKVEIYVYYKLLD